MWIAGKKMTIKRNGEHVEVTPGDPVPEADTWPNRDAWENQGYIRLVGRRLSVEEEAAFVRMSAEGRAGTAVREGDKAKAPAKETAVDVTVDRPTKVPTGDEVAPEELKGPGECPYCGGDFLRLELHVPKCKKNPANMVDEDEGDED